MARNVLCVTSDLSVEDLSSQLLEHDISGAPVVDDAGKPIGVVSKTDLLRWSYERGDEGEPLVPRGRTEEGYEEGLGTGFHSSQLGRTTVQEIMTPVVFALSENVPVTRAAALMAYEGVHRIPVVSFRGDVVGLLSALDIVRWVAEADGYQLPRPRAICGQ
jgi:CBS domain-containing protein